MDLKVEEISYTDGVNEVRYTIGKDGVSGIIEDANTITIIKNTENLVLSKQMLGNWTLHMYANVLPV